MSDNLYTRSVAAFYSFVQNTAASLHSSFVSAKCKGLLLVRISHGDILHYSVLIFVSIVSYSKYKFAFISVAEFLLYVLQVIVAHSTFFHFAQIAGDNAGPKKLQARVLQHP